MERRPTNANSQQQAQSVAGQFMQPQGQELLQEEKSGTDIHLQYLKDSFKQAANSLTQLYKQSSHSY
jgi:hypothetical protein